MTLTNTAYFQLYELCQSDGWKGYFTVILIFHIINSIDEFSDILSPIPTEPPCSICHLKPRLGCPLVLGKSLLPPWLLQCTSLVLLILWLVFYWFFSLLLSFLGSQDLLNMASPTFLTLFLSLFLTLFSSKYILYLFSELFYMLSCLCF